MGSIIPETRTIVSGSAVVQHVRHGAARDENRRGPLGPNRLLLRQDRILPAVTHGLSPLATNPSRALNGRPQTNAGKPVACRNAKHRGI